MHTTKHHTEKTQTFKGWRNRRMELLLICNC